MNDSKKAYPFYYKAKKKNFQYIFEKTIAIPKKVCYNTICLEA